MNPRPVFLRLTSMRTIGMLVIVGLGIPAWAQTAEEQNPRTDRPSEVQQHKRQRSAGGEIGSGAGNIGTGAAKGAGSLAKGTGKGAVDLVTLHPVDAAASVGKGAAGAGKDVGVGTVKGTGKIVKGVGKAIRKVF